MFKTINSFLKMICNASTSESDFGKTNRRVRKGERTPTYLIVARDLKSSEKQIFEAAVYYLGVMASLKKGYKDEIVEILNEAIKANKAHPERSAYIEKILRERKLI